jgi:hypothetical protein
MGRHELFKVAAATSLAINRRWLGKHQNFGDMPAIGTQEVKQWHFFLP